MSPELSSAPNANQFTAHLDSGIDKGYDEGKSDLTPIEVMRAREEVIRAIGGPSLAVASEALQSHIEQKRLTPQAQVHAFGRGVTSMRADYGDGTITLDDEELPLNTGIFDKAA